MYFKGARARVADYSAKDVKIVARAHDSAGQEVGSHYMCALPLVQTTLAFNARMSCGISAPFDVHEHQNSLLSPLQTVSRRARIVPFQSAKQRPFYCHSTVKRDILHCNAVVDDDSGDWAPIDIDALSRQVKHGL